MIKSWFQKLLPVRPWTWAWRAVPFDFQGQTIVPVLELDVVCVCFLFHSFFVTSFVTWPIQNIFWNAHPAIHTTRTTNSTAAASQWMRSDGVLWIDSNETSFSLSSSKGCHQMLSSCLQREHWGWRAVKSTGLCTPQYRPHEWTNEWKRWMDRQFVYTKQFIGAIWSCLELETELRTERRDWKVKPWKAQSVCKTGGQTITRQFT